MRACCWKRMCSDARKCFRNRILRHIRTTEADFSFSFVHGSNLWQMSLVCCFWPAVLWNTEIVTDTPITSVQKIFCIRSCDYVLLSINMYDPAFTKTYGVSSVGGGLMHRKVTESFMILKKAGRGTHFTVFLACLNILLLSCIGGFFYLNK